MTTSGTVVLSYNVVVYNVVRTETSGSTSVLSKVLSYLRTYQGLSLTEVALKYYSTVLHLRRYVAMYSVVCVQYVYTYTYSYSMYYY